MRRDFPVLMAGAGLFRSPQPSFEDLHKLKEQGLRSVVNLREESDESRWHCEMLGLNYHHISLGDWTVPTAEQVERFLGLMKDPTQTPLLVHCWAGVGRTGLFVTCWRVSMGMSVHEAIRLSDLETPQMGMSRLQRDWLLAWAAAGRTPPPVREAPATPETR